MSKVSVVDRQNQAHEHARSLHKQHGVSVPDLARVLRYEGTKQVEALIARARPIHTWRFELLESFYQTFGTPPVKSRIPPKLRETELRYQCFKALGALVQEQQTSARKSRTPWKWPVRVNRSAMVARALSALNFTGAELVTLQKSRSVKKGVDHFISDWKAVLWLGNSEQGMLVVREDFGLQFKELSGTLDNGERITSSLTTLSTICTNADKVHKRDSTWHKPTYVRAAYYGLPTK